MTAIKLAEKKHGAVQDGILFLHDLYGKIEKATTLIMADGFIRRYSDKFNSLH